MLQNVFNGLVGGSFLALVALGLAVIFGMLRVVNFAHGALHMLGAFGALLMPSFWLALLVVPLALATIGMLLERTLIHRLSKLDPLYNFLLTFGLTLVFQDLVKWRFGVQSTPYPVPALLNGTTNFGVFDFPTYRVFVFGVAVAVCVAVWFLLSRTRIGMVVRASTERPELTNALGINVSRWVTPVFGFGAALAALAGVLAAPMRAVHPLMGADLIIVVFAVVVIGGLGSIFGSVAAAFVIGVLQALSEAYLDSALVSQILVYVVMAAVLLWRPSGLFGREEPSA